LEISTRGSLIEDRDEWLIRSFISRKATLVEANCTFIFIYFTFLRRKVSMVDAQSTILLLICMHLANAFNSAVFTYSLAKAHQDFLTLIHLVEQGDHRAAQALEYAMHKKFIRGVNKGDYQLREELEEIAYLLHKIHGLAFKRTT
jgi:hypothetical protein